MTPVGVFFICQNEDKCHFVNSTIMGRIRSDVSEFTLFVRENFYFSRYIFSKSPL